MNGIVGRIELRATEPVAIDDVQVYPDVEHKLARVRVHISNATGKPGHGVLVANRAQRAASRRAGDECTRFPGHEDGGQAEIELPMGDDVKLWDEFSPALYDLNLSLRGALLARPAVRQTRLDKQPWPTLGDAARSPSACGKSASAARSSPSTAGRCFLRGTLECAVFPLTGYPPTDVAAWQRIYRIIKSYGLNFMRFHSWCPPEAAFAAADVEGVMLQVEGPQANVTVGCGRPARRVHGSGTAAHGPRLRQPSLVLPDDAGQRIRRLGQAAVALDRHAQARRPAASLFVAFVRAAYGQSAVYRGHAARHSRAGDRRRFRAPRWPSRTGR